MDNYNGIWEIIIKRLKNEINNDVFYNDFVLKSEIVKIIDTSIVIKMPNIFSKKVMENNYSNFIKNLFFENLGKSVELIFISEEENIPEIKKNNIGKNSNLNKNLNFQNYIVGQFNKQVYNAAKMILDEDKIDILFIYGNPGVGKTHISNSIGLEYLEKGKNVLYINADDFVREIYKYLSSNPESLESYKDSFNDIDLLIVDDIQFFSNKEKINEIFFSIFNRVNQAQSKIILTCDRIPNELNINQRMVSRFNSGLTLKIKNPDLDTIKEIIIKKIKDKNITNIFTNGAIEYISNRYNTDIRSIEGIVNKIYFYIKLNDDESVINEEKIKEILLSEIQDKQFINDEIVVSPNIIIERVCSAYSISKEDVISKNRSKKISFIRNVCIYIIRKKNNISYSKIGSYFSNRDHSTILDSYNKIEDLINNDDILKNFIDNLIKNL